MQLSLRFAAEADALLTMYNFSLFESCSFLLPKSPTKKDYCVFFSWRWGGVVILLSCVTHSAFHSARSVAHIKTLPFMSTD